MRNVAEAIRQNALPFAEWIGELRSRDVLRADIIAGITVALVLVPQSMAYAQLAGLPPYVGLYASFLPVIIASIWGSSRQLATGPVAVVSLMTAAALGPLAGSGTEGYVVYAAMLAILVGVFQFSLGVLRLGVLVDFLSHPVVVGFTNGAAIIIATSQLSKLFGVSVEKATHHYETVWRVLVAASENTHLATLLMGIAALAIMVLLKKYLPKVPNVLTAVAVTTVVAWIINFESAGGKVVGVIPEGLPAMKIPEFDFGVIVDLSMAAVFISLIGFMEAISIAKAMASQTRQRLDANQELIGQGLSNMAAGLFQAYPVSGSFSRSAVNFSAGARTGFSMLVTGAVVAVTLLFLTPLLYHLPQATLAAVIIMAVINLVKIEPIKHAMKVQPMDGVVAIVTFAMTLVIAPHVEWAIATGVLLSLILYLYRTMRPRFAELSMHDDGSLHDAHAHGLATCSYVSLFRFDGSLYFANAGYLENRVLQSIAEKPNLKYVILDAEGINQIDATGEEILHSMAERLHAIGIGFLVARAKKQLVDALKRVHAEDYLPPEHYFRTSRDAVKYAFEQIGDEFSGESPLLAPIHVDQAART